MVRGIQVENNEILKNWFYLFFLLCTGFIYTVGSFSYPAVFFILASLLACCILIFRINDPVLRTIILVAFAVRVGLALVQAYTAIDLPGAGADAATFEREGWLNARGWLYGGEGGESTGAYYYSAWIGLLYYFFGRVEFIPKLMNIYFSIMAVFILYNAVLIITRSGRAGQIAALLLTVAPSINVFSAILLRETPIIFFCLLSFYCLISWMQNGRIVYFAGSFFALALAGVLHGAMFLLFIIHIIFLCSFSPHEQRFKLMCWQLIIAVIFVILAFLLMGNVITYMLPENLAEIFDPDHLRRMVSRKTTGRTAYLEGIVPTNYFDIVWQTPLRVFYFLFAPLPWTIEKLSDLMFFLENLYYAVLLYLAFLGSKYLWWFKKHIVISAMLIIVSLVVMFAWGTANYGTAWRHKQKIAPFVIVLASTGVAASPRLKKLFSGDEVLHKDEKISFVEDLQVAKDENCR